MSSKSSSMISVAKRFTTDGWLNVLTGLGSKLRDKRLGAEISYFALRETDVEQLYAADDVAASIVDTLPEDALRQWFKFTSDVEGLAHEVDVALDKIQLNDRLSFGWKWGRLYGGSALLINVDDSRALNLPIDLNQIRELKSLTILTRYELDPGLIDLDISSPRFGQPHTYKFKATRGESVKSGDLTKSLDTEIHHSRIIRFDGVRLPFRQAISNQYWGDSVLTRAYNPIRNYNTAHDSVATILQEFNQGVFTMEGLADMLLAGEDAAIQKRMETINLARSVCRSVVIDKTETFSNVSVNLSGIPETLNEVAKRLVVASKMPHTKLLGESPSGLGATGNSEMRNWYDSVSNQQELVLRPKIQYILEILLASRNGPMSGKIPPQWSFEFLPLYQPTEKEQIETKKLQAEIDSIYIEKDVLDPDEVSASRFGGGKYSFDTTIDEKARQTPADDDLED